MAEPNQKPHAYRADIDGLRALAVVAVVLFHAEVQVFSGGFAGVDVFFVLSGFLITSIIVRDLDRGTFSFSRFFARRAKRLFPALYLMMAFSLVAGLWILAPDDLVQLTASMAAAGVYISNVYFWRTSGYFDGPSEFKPVLHTWSLSVEEQFYLVTPLLLAATHRWLPKALRPGMWVIVVGSFCGSLYGSYHAVTSTFFLLPTRYWELGAGCLLGLGAIPGARVLSGRLAVPASWIGLALVMFGFFAYDAQTPFPGVAALAPVVGTLLLLISGSECQTPLSRALSHPILVGVGALSYALYLWHWPLLVYARYLAGGVLTPSYTLVALCLAVVASVLSYRWVEQPCRHAAISNGTTLFASVLPMVLLVVLAVGVERGDGLPQRFPAFQDLPIKRGANLGCVLRGSQRPTAWKAENCALTTGTGPRVLLWGDSLASQYASGVQTLAGPEASTVFLYGQTECMPAYGYTRRTRKHCGAVNAKAEALIDELEIDIVVMAARWQLPFKQKNDRAFSLLQQTLDSLKEKGVTVRVVGQTPVFALPPKNLTLYVGDAPEVRVPSPMMDETNEMLRSLLDAGDLIDPTPHLCDSEGCLVKDAGGYLYMDMVHLSERGSVLATESYLAPALRR